MSFNPIGISAVGIITGIVIAIKKYHATAQGRMQIDKFLAEGADRRGFDPKSLCREIYAYAGNAAVQRRASAGWLIICAKTSGNKVIEETLMNARVSISGGKTIADPLAAKPSVSQDGHPYDCGRRIDGCVWMPCSGRSLTFTRMRSIRLSPH